MVLDSSAVVISIVGSNNESNLILNSSSSNVHDENSLDRAFKDGTNGLLSGLQTQVTNLVARDQLFDANNKNHITSMKTLRNNATYIAALPQYKFSTKSYKWLDGTPETTYIESNGIPLFSDSTITTFAVNIAVGAIQSTNLNFEKTITSGTVNVTPILTTNYVLADASWIALFGYPAADGYYSGDWSQKFSNSGINIDGTEVQVLDSYFVQATETTGYAGCLYNSTSAINIAMLPGKNNYIIVHDKVQFNTSYKCISPEYATVFINNVLVQYRALPIVASSFARYPDFFNKVPISAANTIVSFQNHNDKLFNAYQYSTASVSEHPLLDTTTNTTRIADLSQAQILYTNHTTRQKSVGVEMRPLSGGGGPTTRIPFYLPGCNSNRITFVDASGIASVTAVKPNDAMNLLQSQTIYGSYQLNVTVDELLGRITFGDGYVLHVGYGETLGNIYDKTGSLFKTPDFKVTNEDTFIDVKLIYSPPNTIQPSYVSATHQNAEVTIVVDNKTLYKYLELPDTSVYSSILAFQNAKYNVLTGVVDLSTPNLSLGNVILSNNPFSTTLGSIRNWYRLIDNFNINFIGSTLLNSSDPSNVLYNTRYNGPNAIVKGWTNGYLAYFKCVDISNSIAYPDISLNTTNLPSGYKVYCSIYDNYLTINDIIKGGTQFSDIETFKTTGMNVKDSSYNGLISATRKYRMYVLLTDASNVAISKPIYVELGDLNNLIFEYGTTYVGGVYSVNGYTIGNMLQTNIQYPVIAYASK